MNEYHHVLAEGRGGHIPDAKNPKIGPGTYNIIGNSLSGPSFQFGTEFRFSRSGSSSLFSPNISPENTQKILKNNKDMKRFRPESREQIGKLRSEIEIAKIYNAQRKKELLIYQKRLNAMNKIESKQRRLEIRIKKDQMDCIGKS